MFIEPLLPGIRAPAERNVSDDEREIEHVSLRWSEEESHGGRCIYEHFVPFDPWGEEAARAEDFVRKQEGRKRPRP